MKRRRLETTPNLGLWEPAARAISAVRPSVYVHRPQGLAAWNNIQTIDFHLAITLSPEGHTPTAGRRLWEPAARAISAVSRSVYVHRPDGGLLRAIPGPHPGGKVAGRKTRAPHAARLAAARA